MYKLPRPHRPTIGVLAGWQGFDGVLDSFLSNVFRGIQAAAQQMGWNLMISCGVIQRGLHANLTRPAWPLLIPEADFLPVGPWNCDGILVVPPFHVTVGLDYIRDLQAKGFPIAYTGDWEEGPGAVVDNITGVKSALFHLVEHGHRHIAFVAGRKSLLEGDSVARMKGYQQGLVDAGLPYDPQLIEYGFHTIPGGYEAGKKLLAKKKHFTAIIASNDQSAIGAIDALKEAGLLVPQDVAVIGFDDRLEGRANVPSLTTIHYPMFEMGFRTAEILNSILQRDQSAAKLVRVPTRLLIRESCGCLPGDHADVAAGTSHRIYLSSEQQRSNASIELEIAQSLYNDLYWMNRQDVEFLSLRLKNNFTVSLDRKDPVYFLYTLQQVLDFYASRGEDLHAFQKAISILRERLDEILGGETKDRYQLALEILDQARLVINETARRETARLVVRNSHQAETDGQMMARFFAATSEEELLKIFNHYIPQFGIKHAAVFFYEEEGNDPVAWSRQVGSLDKKGWERRFVTRHFPPPGLYPDDAPFNLALLPLQTSEGVVGYVAYEGNNLEQCGLINIELMAALKGIQLYQAAVESRKQAEEANRLKSTFLSMVSHELRTPLNLISGLSNMLLRDRDGKDDTVRVHWDDLERIYISAQHLDGLIRDVIELSSLDIGNINLVCQPMDLQDVLEPVSVIGKQLARDKGLRWSTEIPNNLPWVLGDPTRLRQVILNLVTNAVKFTTKGHILLAAFIEEHCVTVAVSDSGLGVPLEEQQVIFDEFRQSSRTTARGFGGFGLGLAICRRLVEMHGGRLAVSSSGKEGEGSMFYFSLPAIDRPLALDEVGATLDETHRVLILAKDEAPGNLLSDHLSNQGFNAILCPANSADSWYTSILKEKPDAVILDRTLTSERGWEILRYLKERPATADVPVFFYTLDEADCDCGSLLEMTYMTKPVNAAVLTEALMALDLQMQHEEADWEQGKQVLIVDDDPGILDLHTRIVNAQSRLNRVIQAHNGREALKLMKEKQPDLILLDLMMPEMDGFAVLEAMREDEKGRNIPVVVVTAQTLNEEDMQRLNQGVASVLGKGMFSRQETLDALSAALTRSKKPGTEAQRLVLKAMAFIHTHYKDTISRSDIAAHVGVSERHLARCFQNEVGLTPITYLNRFRVKIAKALLDENRKSITEVAMEAGFSSGGYFTRVFRDEVGISPRAYLQSNRN